MKPGWRHSVALLVLLAAVLLVFRSAPYLGFRRPPIASPGGAVVRGAVHVHLPGRTRGFHEMIEAARAQKLDFLIFATGGGLDAAGDRREGYYTVRGPGEDDGPPLLVLIAAETPSDRGNLLLLSGAAGADFPLTRRAPALAAAASRSGGVAIALGPCSLSPPQEALAAPDYPDPPEGVTGVETMSLISATRTAVYLPRALAAALAPWSLDGALASMSPTWFPDREQPAPLDWPGPAAPLGGIARDPGRTWFDGSAELGQALGWVVTRARLARPPGRTKESFAGDRAALLEALAGGRTLAATESWGDPAALRLERVDGGFRAAVEGDVGAWLVLRQDGEIRASAPGPVVEGRDDGTGTWRAELYRRRRDVGLTGSGWVLWVVAAEAFAEEPA